MYEDLRYVIITREEVASVDFSKVCELSADTLRYSLDGNKTFVKYNGSQPDFLSGKEELTNSEIRTELAKSEWQDSGN